MSTTGAATAFLPVVPAQALAVAAGGASLHLRRIERISGRTKRGTELSAHRLRRGAGRTGRRAPGTAQSRPRGTHRRRARTAVARAAVVARARASGVPAERQRHRLYLPWPRTSESLVGAEHPVEKTRGVRMRELSAQAMRPRPAFAGTPVCETPCEDCGKRGLLFWESAETSASEAGCDRLRSESVRSIVERASGRKAWRAVSGARGQPLDPAKVAAARPAADGKRPSPRRWEKCSGGMVVDVVAEGWDRVTRGAARSARPA